MENIHDTQEGNDEMGYQASVSSVDQNEQSSIELDSFAYCRSNSEVSAFSERTTDDNISCSDGTPSPLCWPAAKSPILSRIGMRPHKHVIDDKPDDQESADIELELMKEKFSKLLLGEDMSGSGKGVCTAVTVSNAITNLYASVFGRHLRLEPLSNDKILKWRREMNCLLSVCDYIVEFVPASQSLQDGTLVEVMNSRPRLDIYINLPALRKLDAMLIEILESFKEAEFWYAEHGSMSGSSINSGSFRKLMKPTPQRAGEKWWLPVPCVPPTGLSDKSRKHLRQKRDAANQIHKAAMAINSSILSEMEIPNSYMDSLPKSGKASLGDSIYRYMYSNNKFSPEYLMNCLNLSSEHEALELADRVEASMYTWRRKACLSYAKSSWDLVKEIITETDKADKNTILAERAETLLFCLKQRYPELSQTTLDTSKIQYNRDVGQAILESYSRVLEGLAFNIVAWVEDVLFVDKSMRNQDE